MDNYSIFITFLENDIIIINIKVLNINIKVIFYVFFRRSKLRQNFSPAGKWPRSTIITLRYLLCLCGCLLSIRTIFNISTSWVVYTTTGGGTHPLKVWLSLCLCLKTGHIISMIFNITIQAFTTTLFAKSVLTLFLHIFIHFDIILSPSVTNMYTHLQSLHL